MLNYKNFRSGMQLQMQQWIDTRNIPTNLRSFFIPVEAIALDGKFLRPYVYTLFANKTNPDKVALSLELLHLFALVHDDLIDKSPLRRGHETLHTALNTSYPATNEAVTIIVGDWILQQSFQQICMADCSLKIEMLQVYNQLLEEVTYGQLLDIDFTNQSDVCEADIQTKNTLKTAHYSFTRPMILGWMQANEAKLTEDQKIWFEDVGTVIGLYFQTQDDLLDITVSDTDMGKPAFNDIREGQWTLIRRWLKDTATTQEWKRLVSLQGEILTNDDTLWLQDLIQTYHIVPHINKTLTEYEILWKTLQKKSPDPYLVTAVDHVWSLLRNRSK